MNVVILIGRVARDPDMRSGENTTVARFALAVDRGKRDGKDLGADFPNVVCFGNTAELVGKYLSKGRLVGVSGRIQTDSYTNKDGVKVYTTDVVANRVEFLDYKDKAEAPEGFSKLDDDISF